MKAITFIESIYLGKLHINFKKYLYSYLHITNIYFSEIRLSEKDFFLQKPKTKVHIIIFMLKCK